MRLVIELTGDVERRLTVSALKNGLSPEATAAKAIGDLYYLIDRLTAQERARIFASAMSNPGLLLKQ